MNETSDQPINRRSLREMAPRFKLLAGLMPEYVTQLEDWLARAREYGERFVRPRALEIDRRCARDPRYFEWELVRSSAPFGFFSINVPTGLGGGGQLATALALVMEELCAICPGVANIFGANGLGVSGVLLGLDLYHYDFALSELVAGERRNDPMIFSAAITEPLAGSDVEDAGYLRTAKLMCEAAPVKGGYRLNGRKVFISNGSVAEFHTVIMPLDRARPNDTLSGFVVRSGDPGFSIGRVEEKMGMKACPAAELVFEDCFIPKQRLIGREGLGVRFTEMVLGASRGPVGAIATGTARAAFERAFEFCRNKRCGGRRLIDQQWVQIRLADMSRRIFVARQAYLDACMAFDFTGMPRMMKLASTRLMLDVFPAWLRKSKAVTGLLRSDVGSRYLLQQFDRNVPAEDLRHIQQYSSIAKVTASDFAMQIAHEALQIVGLESCLQRLELEKIFRDAKLTQIYEGTNQLNRHNVFLNQFPHEAQHG